MRLVSRFIVSLLIAALWSAISTTAASARSFNILVLSSYNPEANNVANSINSMEHALHESGLDVNITVESLGYDYVSEFTAWRGRMSRLLAQYKTHNKRPDIIVTLGQEAMSAYLSVDVSDTPDVPVLCGICSRNYVELPRDKSKTSSEWMAETHDITESATLYNIIGGHFYSYDVGRNLALIKDMFPETERVAFLSDNSYGGICMKSLVREYASHHRDAKLMWLDGRNLTIQSATDTIAHLNDRTSLLIGTWRFDKDSRYFITSSLSILRQNNKRLPIFTMSAVGLNDCAIGGYMPNYTNIGLLLAKSIEEYVINGKSQFNFIESNYVFNDAIVTSMHVDRRKIPSDAILLNKEVSVIEKYWSQILTVICIIVLLSACLAIAIHNLRKVSRLKSELERKQKELIIAKNRAESNSMLKTSFVANMSHEIRTPLNAVVGFSQVIASQGDSLTSEERERIVEIINKNCNLLTNLINSILDISRIESGRANYKLESVDVVETCKTMLSSVQMANNKLPIDFRFDCEIDQLMFDTDRQRLQQVLMNLLGNAVKFTQQGRVTLRLQAETNGGIRISVTDTGKGIPPDKAEEVFHRFVKLDEYSNGTGLGLSLCQLIVEKFQGKIWVDTAYTAGARFIFTLPHITQDDIL